MGVTAFRMRGSRRLLTSDYARRPAVRMQDQAPQQVRSQSPAASAEVEVPVNLATDADLLVRSQHRDQAAFTELVERYRAPLIRVCESYLKDHHLAEDSAQVTLERAWLKIGDCRGEFRPWLFKIARNHALDELKTPEHRRFAQFPNEDDQAAITGAGEPLAEIVARRVDLFTAISSLPPSYRAVVELRVTDERFDTIAKRLGIRPATARKHYQRALGVLRMLLVLGESSKLASNDAG